MPTLDYNEQYGGPDYINFIGLATWVMQKYDGIKLYLPTNSRNCEYRVGKCTAEMKWSERLGANPLSSDNYTERQLLELMPAIRSGRRKINQMNSAS